MPIFAECASLTNEIGVVVVVGVDVDVDIKVEVEVDVDLTLILILKFKFNVKRIFLQRWNPLQVCIILNTEVFMISCTN